MMGCGLKTILVSILLGCSIAEAGQYFYVNGDNVNFRSMPGSSRYDNGSTIIGRFQRNSRLEVMHAENWGRLGTWYAVRDNRGRIGYVYSRLMSRNRTYAEVAQPRPRPTAPPVVPAAPAAPAAQTAPPAPAAPAAPAVSTTAPPPATPAALTTPATPAAPATVTTGLAPAVTPAAPPKPTRPHCITTFQARNDKDRALLQKLDKLAKGSFSGQFSFRNGTGGFYVSNDVPTIKFTLNPMPPTMAAQIAANNPGYDANIILWAASRDKFAADATICEKDGKISVKLVGSGDASAVTGYLTLTDTNTGFRASGQIAGERINNELFIRSQR